jgi:hypothetical protein
VTQNFLKVIAFGAEIAQDLGVLFFTEPVIFVVAGLAVLGDEMVAFWGSGKGWHVISL